MNPMSITRMDLGGIVNYLLNFLDENKIASLSDLERIKDTLFSVEKDKIQYIHVQSIPTNSGIRNYTITYNVPGKGAPLEVEINKESGYTKIILKGNFPLPEYEPLNQDGFGNIPQNKKLDSVDISQMRLELEKLINYIYQ